LPLSVIVLLYDVIEWCDLHVEISMVMGHASFHCSRLCPPHIVSLIIYPSSSTLVFGDIAIVVQAPSNAGSEPFVRLDEEDTMTAIPSLSPSMASEITAPREDGDVWVRPTSLSLIGYASNNRFNRFRLRRFSSATASNSKELLPEHLSVFPATR
jgi:hypothetical protein